MYQQLISTHKQNLKYIFDRFPRDVAYYSQMRPPQTGLQPAIDHLTAENVVLWVKEPDGTIAAKSMALSGRTDNINETLMNLPAKMIIPQKDYISGRYWLWCSGSLTVKGTYLGQFYIAQDITSDRTMLVSVVRSLGMASVAAIAGITVAIAFYVRRSLSYVRQLSQLTDTISADDLGNARMKLDRAPTEVRELARTCNLMLERLSEAWEQQRLFVSNVSHELRTPLSIVSGYLQSTLRRGTNLTEPQREALEIAVGEADRTIQLLQDLLDLARADSGYLRFHIEPLPIADLVTEVAAMARQYTNREIEVHCGTGLLKANGDRDRLKQVLLNLIDNAVKYSNSSTSIVLQLRTVGDRVAIDVCDKGSGIPLPHQARIFERFYRVDEARARSTGGTGLGLSIVKTLVEGMGGSVFVRSKLGDGSVFTVTLPAISL